MSLESDPQRHFCQATTMEVRRLRNAANAVLSLFLPSLPSPSLPPLPLPPSPPLPSPLRP